MKQKGMAMLVGYIKLINMGMDGTHGSAIIVGLLLCISVDFGHASLLQACGGLGWRNPHASECGAFYFFFFYHILHEEDSAADILAKKVANMPFWSSMCDSSFVSSFGILHF